MWERQRKLQRCGVFQDRALAHPKRWRANTCFTCFQQKYHVCLPLWWWLTYFGFITLPLVLLAMDLAHSAVATSDSIKWSFLQRHPPGGCEGHFSIFTFKHSTGANSLTWGSCAHVSRGSMLRWRIAGVGILHFEGGWCWLVLKLKTSRLRAPWRQEPSLSVNKGYNRGQLLIVQRLAIF